MTAKERAWMRAMLRLLPVIQIVYAPGSLHCVSQYEGRGWWFSVLAPVTYVAAVLTGGWLLKPDAGMITCTRASLDVPEPSETECSAFLSCLKLSGLAAAIDLQRSLHGSDTPGY